MKQASWWSALSLIAAVGCGGTTDTPMGQTPGTPANPPATTPTTGNPVGVPGVAGAPTPGVTPQPGATPTPTPTPGIDVTPPSTAGELPCDVATLAQTYCQDCHAATPRFSAPMPLVTAADFAAPAPSDASRTVADVVRERINLPDGPTKMPPASVGALSAEELASFNSWLDAGAQAGAACAPTAPVPTPTAGAPGPTPTPAPPAERDNVTCYEFRAHAPGDMDAPYSVGVANDAYFNFTHNAPWDGTQYAVSFRNLLDNEQVVHHWLMYKDPSRHANAGSVSPSAGAHPGGELVHGWAPGGDNLELTKDIGIEMPSTGFTLELHYNSSDASATDHSGIEICVTPDAPAHKAAVSWLGTDAISGTTSASGTCTPTSNERIRILGGTPHMHTFGKSMKVEILDRTGQVVKVIHDEPFDFEYQRSYDFQDQEVWLEPGQRIRTTCNWTRPVNFGEGTGDEMCYFFTLHYPAFSLTSPGLGAIIHGPNQCGVL